MSQRLCPTCNSSDLRLFDGVEMPPDDQGSEQYAVCAGCKSCGLVGPDAPDEKTAWKLWDRNAALILGARLKEHFSERTLDQAAMPTDHRQDSEGKVAQCTASARTERGPFKPSVVGSTPTLPVALSGGDTRIESRTPTRYAVRTEAGPSAAQFNLLTA